MYSYSPFVDFVRATFGTEEFIPLHAPLFIAKEREYVLDCLDSTFVSSVGPYVTRFEDQIKAYTGAKYAIATVNGTAALHMALLVAGVGRDDLVITQPLSFIATCNAISYLGAEPLFVDVDVRTLGLSAEKLSDFLRNETLVKVDGRCYHKASGRRIAACVPMHTFGHPVEIESIAALCAQYNVPLVEDAAESLGSTVEGKHTGTYGLLGTYSFNGNKTITCGGGGMVVTNDEKLAQLTKHLTTQAKVPHRWDFEHDHIGYNYRLPNLNAALACAQLEQLDAFIANKRELAALYRQFFAGNEADIQFVSEPTGAQSNYWLNAILLKDREARDAFLIYTNDHGVMTRPAWQLMNKLPMFRHCIAGNLDQAQWIEERLVNLPSSVRT